MQLGRVISNDQVYMGYANVGSVQIGGPYQVPANPAEPARNTRQPQSDFRLPAAQGRCGTTCLRDDDPLQNGSAGVSASGDESGHGHAAGVLR